MLPSRQADILAISTFNPVGLRSLNGMRMFVCVYTGIVLNELIRGYAKVVHTLSSFPPHTHTHTLFAGPKPIELKVDIADMFTNMTNLQLHQ